MAILLTNDDGYGTEGINTLFALLSKEHDVYMIAPESNSSVVSNYFLFFPVQDFLPTVFLRGRYAGCLLSFCKRAAWSLRSF